MAKAKRKQPRKKFAPKWDRSERRLFDHAAKTNCDSPKPPSLDAGVFPICRWCESTQFDDPSVGGTVAPLPGVKLYVLTCKTCGYVHMFNADTLLNLESKQTRDEEAEYQKRKAKESKAKPA